mmetsp:Transcript_18732/g.45913  ORF Transcript_18732/g.45913 Transcript_18732/m.45913 type:complete len:373 (-) Transcript_18732:229-1347(-)
MTPTTTNSESNILSFFVLMDPTCMNEADDFNDVQQQNRLIRRTQYSKALDPNDQGWQDEHKVYRLARPSDRKFPTLGSSSGLEYARSVISDRVLGENTRHLQDEKRSQAMFQQQHTTESDWPVRVTLTAPPSNYSLEKDRTLTVLAASVPAITNASEIQKQEQLQDTRNYLYTVDMPTSRQKELLNLNQRKVHECKICLKRFSHKGSLTVHSRIHSGIRPHKCPICPKEFTQRGNLTTHIRTHTNEKPFSCKYCGKAFSHKSNLHTHIQIHTGERPFRCIECGKTFARKSRILSHLRTHGRTGNYTSSKVLGLNKGAEQRARSSVSSHSYTPKNDRRGIMPAMQPISAMCTGMKRFRSGGFKNNAHIIMHHA